MDKVIRIGNKLNINGNEYIAAGILACKVWRRETLGAVLDMKLEWVDKNGVHSKFEGQVFAGELVWED